MDRGTSSIKSDTVPSIHGAFNLLSRFLMIFKSVKSHDFANEKILLIRIIFADPSFMCPGANEGRSDP